MLKYQKNLISILSRKISILVPYNITIQEKISDKLKKCSKHFGNIKYKFLKYFDNDFVKLVGKFGSHFRNKYIGENQN